MFMYANLSVIASQETTEFQGRVGAYPILDLDDLVIEEISEDELRYALDLELKFINLAINDDHITFLGDDVIDWVSFTAQGGNFEWHLTYEGSSSVADLIICGSSYRLSFDMETMKCNLNNELLFQIDVEDDAVRQDDFYMRPVLVYKQNNVYVLRIVIYNVQTWHADCSLYLVFDSSGDFKMIDRDTSHDTLWRTKINKGLGDLSFRVKWKTISKNPRW